MIKIRRYNKNDLDSIKVINSFLAIEFQWNNDFHDNDVYVAVDKTNTVVGYIALFYGNTWYYIDKGVTHIPVYYFNLEYDVLPSHNEEKEIKHKLFAEIKSHLASYKSLYPDKTIAMRCFIKDSDSNSIQFLLSEGFSAYGITPVLSFDLRNTIPTYTIPENITIGIHSFEGDGMQQYLKANSLGYGNIQDSEAELLFRLNDPSVRVYTAKDGDTVVSSVTTWAIDDTHSTTENIFTIPNYRRQNIGRETIATALRELKANNKNIATLTVLGRNLPAIKMYMGMGYTYIYSLFEMRYTL